MPMNYLDFIRCIVMSEQISNKIIQAELNISYKTVDWDEC